MAIKIRDWLTPLGLVVCVGSAFALSIESQGHLSASYADESQGLIRAAIEKTVLAYKSEPSDYLVNYRLGWLFYLDRKYKNSIDHYTRAAGVAPLSLEPLLGLSQTLLAAEEYAKAWETCKSILKLDPGNYVARQRSAQAQLKLKLFAEALETTTRALASYPTDAIFLEQKGFALKQLGREEEARATLTLLLLVNPHNVYARAVLDEPRRLTKTDERAAGNPRGN